MPLYNYECKECSERFDAFRTVAQRDDSPSCPSCGSSTTSREYKPFAVSVKSGESSCPASKSCPHGGACGCH